MMAVYKEKIAPKVFLYTKEDVARSFGRYRENQKAEDAMLSRMIEG